MGTPKGFIQDDSGAIATEAVIILPILLFFYVASFVFYDAFRAYNVTVKAAYTLGDAVSRLTDKVTSDDVEGLKALYDYLSSERNPDTSWIRLSQIQFSGSTYTAEWTYATGGNPGLTATDVNTISYKLPIMADGERVVVLETYSNYEPILDVGIDVHTWENFVFTRTRFADSLPFELSS